MDIYVDLVAFLNFLVDFLLLLGTNRLCGYPPGYKRATLAAVIGGLYGGLCLIPGVTFLSNILWCVAVLALMACIAFGFNRSALRRGVIFVLLSMALGGIAVGLGSANMWSLIVAAGCVCSMCFIGFHFKPGTTAYIPIELAYRGKRMYFFALQDTGNTLRDPITGSSVLVVGADIAGELTGLTKQQLARPVETMEKIKMPGLRLIPYRAVGKPEGFLLALRLPEVTIGKWKGSSLVAFAPDTLSQEGDYQALTGGIV